ncbi:hypothetical protein POTOM_058398 [Populus tomentosa]|uniref:Uncharacterized protein n=1 Tax=Populus tomentosa TaxID=118781 RepID=A0A8X7XUG0_POPTO|nr:hypothetical protein POTOM_058398 [Populus tomentosa]
MSTSNHAPELQTPLLYDIVDGSGDHKGRPVYRSNSGGWRSAGFIIVFVSSIRNWRATPSAIALEEEARGTLPHPSSEQYIAPLRYQFESCNVTGSSTKPCFGHCFGQRIGTGIFLSVATMVIAALVEMKRLKTAQEHGLVDLPDVTIPMSFWWLIPQYVLFGIAQSFTMVALQEFFYDQVPSDLRSVGISLKLSIFGAGNFLSSFLISVIEKATDSCLEELHQSLDAKGYRIRPSQTSANSGEVFASSVRLLNCLRAKLWSGLFIINGVLTEGFS